MATPLPAVERPWLAKYPSGVPSTVAIPDQLLTEFMADAVRRWPDRAAILYYGSRWTYRELWSASERFAASLVREGVRPGDRVALYLPNCPAYPIAFFGALRAGAIVVQVSPLYLGQDLARLLTDARPKVVVTLEIVYPHLAKIRTEAPVPVVFVARLREFYPWYLRPFVNSVLRRQKLPTDFPKDPWVRPFQEATRTPGTIAEPHRDPATTVALYQYTGGTTGVPKAAMLSHRNLVANVLQLDAWDTVKRGDLEVALAAIPCFHIYGLTVALLLPLHMGGAVVLETKPEIREILKLIDRYQPTQFPGVPALYQAFVMQPDIARHRIRSIRFCLSGSAPLPLEVARQFEALTGGKIIEGYGLSETSPATHANPVDGERRVGSIGLPLPDTEQRVVDLETGTRVLGTDEVGELSVKGPQVMLGYFAQPGETDAVLCDGWFRTGDIARIDADGYAYIVDRKKDMIDVGGFKVYPREVEEVLYQHPAVREAAVVGIPDPGHGEIVKAFVVRKPGANVGAEELIAFVRQQIAHYKAPRAVEFRDALPRSGVQKVLRRVLRDEATGASGAGPTVPAR